VNQPPPSADIRKQALPTIDLDRSWRAGAATGEAVRDNWLKTFNDPVLDQLVTEAIANNPDLGVAATRLEQAGQYLVIARGGLKPEINIFGTGGSKTGGGGDATSALQALVLAASWELDLWGRLRYARNAAQQDYASARADFEFARQSLAATTARAWFTATQLSLQARIAADMTRASNTLASLASDRERVGAGTDADTAVARATALGLESSAQQLELARSQAMRALEILIGRYPSAELSARAEPLALPDTAASGIPLQMLERRPDVVAAERRVAAAFDRVGEAKAARLPQLTLSLNFGAFESEVLELRDDFENPTGGIGGRLLAPLYSGGRLNAQVEIRTLQQREALASYAGIALRAIGEVENALAASASLETQVRLLSQVVNQQTRAFDLTQDRYRVGRADLRAVEQQRISVQQAQTALLAAQTDALTTRVNLHLALGGSFESQQLAGSSP
jgi:NodT family efflux transporter outer membrane factor (OMF) lipoprotein